MTRNEILKKRRVQMGLSEQDVCLATGLSVHEYADIEDYPTEIIAVTPLEDVKAICRVLALDLLEFLDVRCPFCGRGVSCQDEYLGPRNQLIRTQRERYGLSRRELADRLGFEEFAVAEMEQKEEFLESWSIDLIEALAKALNLPIQVLLSLRCPKCGR
jgi:transcriptional regulator with XRE-family HTH domain